MPRDKSAPYFHNRCIDNAHRSPGRVRLPEGFETVKTAASWRREDRKQLCRGNKRQRLLGARLGKCRRGHRCNSEACRVCMRKFRKNLLSEALPILATRPHWTRASIIMAGLLMPYGKLSTTDIVEIVRRLRKRLERSRLRDRMVFGGIDVSLNLERNKIVGWQFHLYLLIEGKHDCVLQNAVKDAFPAEPTALVPYSFSEVVDFSEAITYVYKAIFKRRFGYGTNNNHYIKPYPLKAADIWELLPFLDSSKIGSRLILRRIRRDGVRLRVLPIK